MKQIRYFIIICFAFSYLAGLNYVISKNEEGFDSFIIDSQKQSNFYYTQAQSPIFPAERPINSWKINPQISGFLVKQQKPFNKLLNQLFTQYIPIQIDYPRILNSIEYSFLDLPPPLGMSPC